MLKSSTAQQAKPRSTTADLRIWVGLTGPCGSGKFERLPRCVVVWLCVGVRAILENSTACQKSMPSLISLCGVAFGLSHVSGFSLVELELSQFDSFCSAGISYPSGFVFPFALFGGVGV